MDEQTRKARTLDALELIAAELERLRLLQEHELGVRIEHEEGDPFVRPVEKG
jgi:hypothetical protein